MFRMLLASANLLPLPLAIVTLGAAATLIVPTASRAHKGDDAQQQQDLWCVAKNNAGEQALQAALDWACGPGGADCALIQQGQSCSSPDDMLSTASWAFNWYYLRHGSTDDACNFNGTAALTSLNPSHDACIFTSSTSDSNGSISGSTTVAGTARPPGWSSSSDIARIWLRHDLICLGTGLLVLLSGSCN